MGAALEGPVAGEGLWRVHLRGAGRMVEDEGRGAGLGGSHTTDFHPFPFFELSADEGARSASSAVTFGEGGEEAIAATIDGGQRRRFLFGFRLLTRPEGRSDAAQRG